MSEATVTAQEARHRLYEIVRGEASFEQKARDAMVIVDDEARIVDANSRAASMYGLDRQKLLGQPMPRFLPEGFDFESGWDEFRTAETERDTLTVVGADGERYRVEYAATTDIVPDQHLVVSREVSN